MYRHVSHTASFLMGTVLLVFHPVPIRPQGMDRIADKRMAAHHYSVVCTGTDMPSSAVLTYPVNEFRVQDYNFLLKLMPCLVKDGKKVFPSEFDEVQVSDFPGGIESVIRHRGARVTTTITPLLEGRHSGSWKGAVLYEVETNPPGEIMIYLGGAETINLIWGFEQSVMKMDTVFALEDVEQLGEGKLQFLGGKEDLYVGISASDPVHLENLAGPEQAAYVDLKDGSGSILTCFAEEAAELQAMLMMDAARAKEELSAYYENLMASSIETPVQVMDDAFATAIYNLEYSWLEPFGWGECLHHWLALWYMQVTAAADWLGQGDRSRSSIIEHGRKQFDNGAIPMFNPNHLKLGNRRRDWGGGNTYWVWQVRHYVNVTGDLDFAREILPYVDRTIAQTLEEYDRDGNRLLAWGLQIGNQEDFVANPHDGSVPTMELYNMFMTRAELSEFTGDQESAQLWFRKAGQVKQVLYRELWLKDLGRFAYYRDPTGRILPDGPYQTYLYPVIYDLVDRYDQYTGLRHALDRLTDTAGAIFASNNFPWHVPDNVSTWGMQRGAAQQPWAAMGFAESGLHNLAWKPLKAMAEWAQDPRRPGAWPETGPEPTPAYFTPPAGLYISTIVEALFGLQAFAPQGYLEVSPCFPDHWPYARLNLPGFRVDYSRKDHSIRYVIHSSKDLPLKVKWRLPVSEIKKCSANGKDMPYEVHPGVNHIILTFEVPAAERNLLEIAFEPVDYSVSAPRSIATGEQLSVTIQGASMDRIVDPGGILETMDELTPGKISGRLKPGLLEPYRKFHQLGLLNFSRRTLFADCRTPGGTPFTAAMDLTIMPFAEAAASGTLETGQEGYKLPLSLRNNSSGTLAGKAYLEVGDTLLGCEVDLPPRSEQEITLCLPAGLTFVSGENTARLGLPGLAPLDIRFRYGFPDPSRTFIPIKLPAKDMIPDTLWHELRVMPGFPHIFFTFSSYGWPRPMEALENIKKIQIPEIPGLTFDIPGQHFIPVSHLSGQTSCKLELGRQKYRKLYLLVLPFVDNHDMFSDVARVTVYSGKEMVYGRILSYPGDVDYWVSHRNPTSFASFRGPRDNPFELLPLLHPDMEDWPEGKPPDFPQSKWWSASLPFSSESCVMSVIELNLQKPMELDHMVFESLGALPAFGIVALTGEITEDPSKKR